MVRRVCMNKKFISITILLFIFAMIFYWIWCYFYFTPPHFQEHKIIIDVWNDTNQVISNMVFDCQDPKVEATLPDIQPHQRVVFVMNPLEVESNATEVKLFYNDQSYSLIGELRRNNGAEGIIVIKQNQLLLEDLSYQLNRYMHRFYYKPYHLVSLKCES